MRTMLPRVLCLLLACNASLAQGVFEAPLSVGLGGSATLLAGVGYFRVDGTSVDYRLVVYDLTAGSLSPVIATASFENSFTTGLGQVITVSGCHLIPPNPFLPLPGPPGPITCPAQACWADYWGTFALPDEQVAELLADGGLLRIAGTPGFPFGSGGEIQGTISPVPEPSSFVLLAGGLLWLIRSRGGQALRSTPPNGGLTRRCSRSGASEGPPSVS